MAGTVNWIDGLWNGRVAIVARPRGGKWLADEIDQWRKAGLGVVVSLLTPGETTARSAPLYNHQRSFRR